MPFRRKFKCFGNFTDTLSLSNKNCVTEIYVIEQLCKPILGRPAIKQLGILQFGDGIESQLNNIKSNLINIETKFPNIFESIGTFKIEMTIKINPDVQPRSVPRVVAIPLLKPLKEELERLQNLDIIEPVDNFTSWVSPVVIV